jgi:predicted DNA-binding transcriptional regulator YafY
MRRQARLFAIAEYLRGRRTGVTANLLAERFNVTLRTIYRDLDELRSADLPVHAEQGRGGGYSLDRHYSLPPINLNPREAALLVALGMQAVRLRQLPFTETVQAALDKVRGALSVSAQRELLTTLESLQFVGVPALAAAPAVRAAIEEAWFSHAPVTVHYRRKEGSLSVRTVRIAKVVMERSSTLLNVVDVEDGQRRQYPLHLIERATVARGA